MLGLVRQRNLDPLTRPRKCRFLTARVVDTERERLGAKLFGRGLRRKRVEAVRDLRDRADAARLVARAATAGVVRLKLAAGRSAVILWRTEAPLRQLYIRARAPFESRGAERACLGLAHVPLLRDVERNVGRDVLFVVADLEIAGHDHRHRVEGGHKGVDPLARHRHLVGSELGAVSHCQLIGTLDERADRVYHGRGTDAVLLRSLLPWRQAARKGHLHHCIDDAFTLIEHVHVEFGICHQRSKRGRARSIGLWVGASHARRVAEQFHQLRAEVDLNGRQIARVECLCGRRDDLHCCYSVANSDERRG